MDLNLTEAQWLELKGNLVYLKRNSAVYLDRYTQNLMENSLEARLLTTTAEVFTPEGIERFVRRIESDGSRVDFLIFKCEDNELIGEVVISGMDAFNRNAGFRVAIDRRENFGKGYGTEAMALALNYGFGMKNLHRIELEVLPENERAIRAYKKLGFKEEGVRKEAVYFNHTYKDLMMMAVFQSDFRALFYGK